MTKEKFKEIIIPIILSVLIITILYNFKIVAYNKYFILPIILLIITYLYLLNKNNMIINNKGYRYLIPIILIILGTIIFNTDASNKVINIIIIPILLSSLFLTLTNKNYNISRNFINWFIKLFPSNLLSNIEIVTNNINIKENNRKQISNILLGILLGIPLAIVLLKLLGSADIYFSVFISKLNSGFAKLLKFDNVFKNILVFIIYFIIFFSVYVNIINNVKTKSEDSKIRKIEKAIIIPILMIMNFVFVLFIISEISKVCGNFLNIPSQYTYAQYAREGFFQLLFVTIINFSIILLLIYKTDAIKSNKLIKYLLLTLIGFTIILIFNSYYRMFLYINEFGFTILRMQVVLFLLMELILSVIIIKKILVDLNHDDAKLFELIIITTYILNIFICNHNVIDYINSFLNIQH